MLWCEKCGKGYDEAQEDICPHCGAPLQETAPGKTKKKQVKWSFRNQKKEEPIWPVGEDGRPEPAALLMRSSGLGAEGELMISMLHAFNVPVLQRYPGDGQLGKVVLGFSGYGSDLYVPKSMLDLAKELIAPSEEAEQEGDQ